METYDSSERQKSQSPPPTQTHATPFEQALSVWSDIGLSHLQRNLDDEGVEILELQKKSILTRKELASRTKAFRKLSDDSKLTEIKSLLKLYQGEIDNLTQRSKFSETSFMNLYKLIAEAPDPVPLLEASIDSVLTASEVTTLTEENSRLVEKLNKCADYEQIKTKLMELEIKSIETANAKVLAKESEMKAIIDEKERHWSEREAELHTQVQEARDQIRELRSNSEVLQARLSAKTHDQLASSITDENTSKAAGRIAELELVASDLERANKRVLEVEKRNVELRLELETERSGTQNTEKVTELETRASDLERSNALLAAQLDSSRSSITQAKSTYQKKIDTLLRDIEKKRVENEGLRQKTESMQDYAGIKRELEILKSVEFSYEEEDEDRETEATRTSTNDNNNDTLNKDDEDFAENIEASEHFKTSQSLERLMHARNKKLVNDLTLMRVSKISLEEEAAKLKSELKAVSKDNTRLLQLNEKLEGDLAQTNDTVSKLGTGPAMSVVSGWGRSVIGGGPIAGKRVGRLSPTASIIGGYDPSETATLGSNSSAVADASILPIVTQQRDRFRTRNSELEEDLRKSWSTISQLKKELDSVKRDNVDLYEKARYASSYKRSPATANIFTSGSNTESSYRDIYEEGISPYQQFKGRESERALSKMGPAERALYSLTRTILVNRTSRNLFAAYCVGLHLLVITILMYGVAWHTNNGLTPTVLVGPAVEDQVDIP